METLLDIYKDIDTLAEMYSISNEGESTQKSLSLSLDKDKENDKDFPQPDNHCSGERSPLLSVQDIQKI